MKKIAVSAFLLVLLALVPCAAKTFSVALPNYVWNGEKPLYPAVIYAAVHGEDDRWRKAKIVSVDTDANVYVIENVSGSSGLKLARFTLTITVKDGSLVYAASDVRTMGIGENTWTKADKLVMFDMRIISNNFNAILPKVMADETLYAEAMKEAVAFYPVMKKVPAASAGMAGGDSIANPSNLLLYPAVYRAFAGIKPTMGSLRFAELKQTDCYGNVFTVSNIVVPGGTVPEKRTVTIRCANNALSYNFENAGKIDAGVLMGLSEKEFASLEPFDLGAFTAKMKASVSAILADGASYAAAKKDFLSNTLTLVSAINNLTDLSRDDFISGELVGSPVSIPCTLGEASKNTDPAYAGKAYRVVSYIIENGYRITGQVILYTNDGALARTAKDSPITIEGSIAAVTCKPLSTDIVVVSGN